MRCTDILFDSFTQNDPIRYRHHHIADYHIRKFCQNNFPGLFTVISRKYMVQATQTQLHKFTEICIIIDNE